MTAIFSPKLVREGRIKAGDPKLRKLRIEERGRLARLKGSQQGDFRH
jgi:hypothetical protein